MTTIIISKQLLNYRLWFEILGLKETFIFKMKNIKPNYTQVPTLKTKIELYNRRKLYINEDYI